ncbi:MAG: inositol monophosphatase [Planctomycetaceae bacterium]|nr:inositol monophosphatase [Planctomycetaceae bacterium]
MSEDLEELQLLAEQAARLGGQILQEWAPRFTSREKSPANLVTEADEASQQAIFDLIHSRCPEHRFLGEEGLLQDAGDSPWRWIIDPLDGTSNYVHRFPYYAVSIGLERAGALVVGVIFDPNRDEMFSARLDGGATLNGAAIGPSVESEIGRAMCMASLPVKAKREHPAVQRFLKVLDHAQTVQRTGSAALNLCCVACGRIDAFWSSSLKPWDQAAGALIVQESGGRVTKADRSLFDVDKPDLLATNGSALHATIGALLCDGGTAD